MAYDLDRADVSQIDGSISRARFAIFFFLFLILMACVRDVVALP